MIRLVKIGVLGGTFDPVHKAHIVVAEEVRVSLNLAEVVFVPAGQPWLKEDRPILAAEHRLQMIRLAIAQQPHFKVSTVDIERPGPSYTVETLAALRSPPGTGDELYFILGRDNLAQLPRWRQPSRLIEMCYLVAVPRPGYSLPDLKALEAAIPGLARRLILLDRPNIDMDSTGIRDRVARGQPISHLVPGPVEEYIREHGLYLPG